METLSHADALSLVEQLVSAIQATYNPDRRAFSALERVRREVAGARREVSSEPSAVFVRDHPRTAQLP